MFVIALNGLFTSENQGSFSSYPRVHLFISIQKPRSFSLPGSLLQLFWGHYLSNRSASKTPSLGAIWKASWQIASTTLKWLVSMQMTNDSTPRTIPNGEAKPFGCLSSHSFSQYRKLVTTGDAPFSLRLHPIPTCERDPEILTFLHLRRSR